MWDWHDTTAMTIGMIAFWVLIVAMAYFLFRWATERPDARPPTAIELLEQRFARGEISADEYRERRAVLEGSAASERTRPSAQ